MLFGSTVVSLTALWVVVSYCQAFLAPLSYKREYPAPELFVQVPHGGNNNDESGTNIDVLDAKILLLQGIVKEMKTREATLNEEWGSKYARAQAQINKEKARLADDMKLFDEVKERWKREKRQLESRLEKLSRDLISERNARKKDLLLFRRQEQQLGELHTIIQNQTEQLASEKATLQLVTSEKEQKDHINNELQLVSKERDAALHRLSEILTNRDEDEATQIAVASVAAAEKREASIRKQYDQIKEELDRSVRLQTDLEQKVRALAAEHSTLKQQLEDASNLAPRPTGSLRETDLQEQIQGPKERLQTLTVMGGNNDDHHKEEGSIAHQAAKDAGNRPNGRRLERFRKALRRVVPKRSGS